MWIFKLQHTGINALQFRLYNNAVWDRKNIQQNVIYFSLTGMANDEFSSFLLLFFSLLKTLLHI